MPGTVVRNTDVRLEIPVVPSDTIQAIVNHHLSPNSFSLSRAYPPFDYEHERGIISSIVTPAEWIRRERDEIRSAIRTYNESIQHEHRQFQGEVARAVASKRERVAAKHKGLDDLATKVGIKLVKKVDASQVVPAPAKIRSKIAPILPPTRRPQERPVLDEKTFGAIVDLMERSCRQFEATPQAFAQLTEEGLRDVMLSALNGVFEGAAGGETFRVAGKADIHLQISKGEVFVAEIKFGAVPHHSMKSCNKCGAS
jgi:hypothetical protein